MESTDNSMCIITIELLIMNNFSGSPLGWTYRSPQRRAHNCPSCQCSPRENIAPVLVQRPQSPHIQTIKLSSPQLSSEHLIYKPMNVASPGALYFTKRRQINNLELSRSSCHSDVSRSSLNSERGRPIRVSIRYLSPNINQVRSEHQLRPNSKGLENGSLQRAQVKSIYTTEPSKYSSGVRESFVEGQQQPPVPSVLKNKNVGLRKALNKVASPKNLKIMRESDFDIVSQILENPQSRNIKNLVSKQSSNDLQVLEKNE